MLTFTVDVCSYSVINVIFNTYHSIRWSFVKLNMLFKKYNHMNCDHYIGILIIGTIAKIYDYILYHRLMKWFTPGRQQASALLKRDKEGLFRTYYDLVTFIQLLCYQLSQIVCIICWFQENIQRVSGNKLINTLKILGCDIVISCYA